MLGMGYILQNSTFLLIFASLFGWFGAIQLINALAPRCPKPLARFIHWTHAMTFEFVALLGVAVLRVIHRRSKEPVGNLKGRPILLIHGYVNNSSVWRFQKRAFEKAGLGPIYTIDLGHPFRPIRSYAEKVKAKAEAIAKETGRDDLTLIGHSMGGVVSCWYATQVAPAGKVTDVITIASPLAGTHMARLGLGPNAREMEVDSPLIQTLRSAIAKNRTIRFFHIATKSDQLVIPNGSALIDGNHQCIFEDLGHASLLYSPRVSQKICEWLH